MKRQQSLIFIGLLLATSIVAFGKLPSEEKQRNRLQVLRTKTSAQKHLNQFERAYLDSISLLQRGNACGEFFGGVASAQVLDNFAITLKTELIPDPRTGLVMSGRSTDFFDSQTRISYRLFANAEINRIGPFYRAKVRPEDPLVPNVGIVVGSRATREDPGAAHQPPGALVQAAIARHRDDVLDLLALQEREQRAAGEAPVQTHSIRRSPKGGAQLVGRLRPPQPAREVVLRPEAKLPARVVPKPRLLVPRELVREGVGADPDLVEETGNQHSMALRRVAVLRP